VTVSFIPTERQARHGAAVKRVLALPQRVLTLKVRVCACMQHGRRTCSTTLNYQRATSDPGSRHFHRSPCTPQGAIFIENWMKINQSSRMIMDWSITGAAGESSLHMCPHSHIQHIHAHTCMGTRSYPHLYALL
jgi:hypothetical protein